MTQLDPSSSKKDSGPADRGQLVTSELQPFRPDRREAMSAGLALIASLALPSVAPGQEESEPLIETGIYGVTKPYPERWEFQIEHPAFQDFYRAFKADIINEKKFHLIPVMATALRLKDWRMTDEGNFVEERRGYIRDRFGNNTDQDRYLKSLYELNEKFTSNGSEPPSALTMSQQTAEVAAGYMALRGAKGGAKLLGRANLFGTLLGAAEVTLDYVGIGQDGIHNLTNFTGPLSSGDRNYIERNLPEQLADYGLGNLTESGLMLIAHEAYIAGFLDPAWKASFSQFLEGQGVVSPRMDPKLYPDQHGLPEAAKSVQDSAARIEKAVSKLDDVTKRCETGELDKAQLVGAINDLANALKDSRGEVATKIQALSIDVQNQQKVILGLTAAIGELVPTKDELGNNQARVDRINTREKIREVAELTNTVVQYGQLLGDEKTANTVNIVGSSTIAVLGVVESALELQENPTNVALQLASVNSMLAGGLMVAKALGVGRKGPTFEKIVLKGLKEIADLIGDMRFEMHSRFNYLDGKIDALSRQSGRQFEAISSALGEVLDNQLRDQITLFNIERTVNDIHKETIANRKAFIDAFDLLERREIGLAVNTYVNTALSLSDKEVQDGLTAFYTFAQQSRTLELPELKREGVDDSTIVDRYESFSAARNLNYLTDVLASRYDQSDLRDRASTTPVLDRFLDAATNYLAVARKAPDNKNIVQEQRAQDLFSLGEELLTSLRSLKVKGHDTDSPELRSEMIEKWIDERTQALNDAVAADRALKKHFDRNILLIGTDDDPITEQDIPPIKTNEVFELPATKAGVHIRYGAKVKEKDRHTFRVTNPVPKASATKIPNAVFKLIPSEVSEFLELERKLGREHPIKWNVLVFNKHRKETHVKLPASDYEHAMYIVHGALVYWVIGHVDVPYEYSSPAGTTVFPKTQIVGAQWVDKEEVQVAAGFHYPYHNGRISPLVGYERQFIDHYYDRLEQRKHAIDSSSPKEWSPTNNARFPRERVVDWAKKGIEKARAELRQKYTNHRLDLYASLPTGERPVAEQIDDVRILEDKAVRDLGDSLKRLSATKALASTYLPLAAPGLTDNSPAFTFLNSGPEFLQAGDGTNFYGTPKAAVEKLCYEQRLNRLRDFPGVKKMEIKEDVLKEWAKPVAHDDLVAWTDKIVSALPPIKEPTFVLPPENEPVNDRRTVPAEITPRAGEDEESKSETERVKKELQTLTAELVNSPIAAEGLSITSPAELRALAIKAKEGQEQLRRDRIRQIGEFRANAYMKHVNDLSSHSYASASDDPVIKALNLLLEKDDSGKYKHSSPEQYPGIEDLLGRLKLLELKAYYTDL